MKAEIVIIGAGPAGLAAAREAYNAGARKIILIDRDKKMGGILNQCIHNGFGLHMFGEELTGPEYAGRCVRALPKVELMLDTMVIEVTPERKVIAVSADKGLVEIDAKAIVLAMGCRERPRGVLNISGSRPSGIFTAGTAQKLINIDGKMPGRHVVILGSGDIGLIMARRMTWEGAKVELVAELMPYSSGLNRNIVQCLHDNDIPLLFNTTVVRIHGSERLEGVTIATVDEKRVPIPNTERFIKCDTLLLSVGLIPENELSMQAGVKLDRLTNGAVVDERRHTSMEGIFACGNVLHVHDLADNVSREGGIAGKYAAQYALGQDAPCEFYDVLPVGNVRYAVPHKITKSGTDDVEIYFRVSKVLKSPTLRVMCNGQEIKKAKRLVATPGEMEKILVPRDKISGNIEITADN